MSPATLPRSSGILLHPSSLPGPYGIGDLGPEAHRWIETLAAMKQRWWQVLPLGPTGFGDSPYQSYSAFAGNPNLLSPDLLLRDGLLNANEIRGHGFRDDRVEYDAVGQRSGLQLRPCPRGVDVQPQRAAVTVKTGQREPVGFSH